MTQALLSIQGLVKRYGGLLVTDHVDLDVRAGEVHALIGPNGAGKSTFFNMISGVDDPTEGQVRLMGQVMPRFNAEEVRVTESLSGDETQALARSLRAMVVDLEHLDHPGHLDHTEH